MESGVDDCLDVLAIPGSVNNTAVASTVLAATKDPGISEENTESNTASGIPPTSIETSAASSSLYNRSTLNCSDHNKLEW